LSYFTLGGNLSTIITGILESRAIEKPWLQTENLGNTTTAFAYVTSSAMVGSACLLWSSSLDQRLRMTFRVLVWLIALFVTAIIYFDHGTRSIVALALFPYLIMWILKLSTRSRLYSLVVCLFVLTIAVILLQFQMLYRADYTRSEIFNLLFQQWFTLGGTIDYFKETLFAVRIVPEDHDYFQESAFLQFLISPIPRFIWDDKPASELIWFYTLSRSNVDIYLRGGNILPGIVGQYYMSWSWLGPIMIGMLFGWLSKRFDSFLSRAEMEHQPYICVVGIMLVVWLFISYRLFSPGFFYPVVSTAAVVFLAYKLSQKPRLTHSTGTWLPFRLLSERPHNPA
jgi:oligosaccharide repeat unit polymerase